MKKTILSIPLTTFILSFLTTTSVHAQTSLSDYYLKGSKLTTSSNQSLANFLSPVISNASIVVGLASFLAIILAGFKYITSGDNEKEVKNANTMLTYSLVGLGLSLLAFWFTQLLLRVGGAGNIFTQ